MTNKLYVGNLTEDVTEDDLVYNFNDLGTCLSANIIRDKHTGRSRGFAFVEMATAAEAREAIRICKGVELDGQKLVVTQAKAQVPGQQPGGGRRGNSKRK